MTPMLVSSAYVIEEANFNHRFKSATYVMKMRGDRIPPPWVCPNLWVCLAQGTNKKILTGAYLDFVLGNLTDSTVLNTGETDDIYYLKQRSSAYKAVHVNICILIKFCCVF